MNKNKQMAVNLIAQIIAFMVNFVINFFLSPYIIKHVGREAYGFVSLGNNFVNYASLVSIALNSMAGRFITIKIHQDDFENANKYYSSVIMANIIIAAVLSVPSFLIVMYITRIVNIPESIVGDVRVLWGLLFSNFLFGLVTATFGALLFAANRIDLQSKLNIKVYIIRIIILFGAFWLFVPHVWYIGLASMVCAVYAAFVNLHYAHKFYPQIRFSRHYFDKSKIKELLSSGVWNTVSRVGSIALTELDLLLSNWFVGAAGMGTLSIAKTVPNYVVSFISTITSVFMPDMTITYAKGNREELLKSIRGCMRILLFFNSVIYGILFGFSGVFFKLWLPDGTQDINYIYMLSLITISDCFISATSHGIFNIFTVTNRLRFSSIVVILTGFVSLPVTYILLKTTHLGLIAIAGVSLVLVVARNIGIFLPYGAKCIGEPWYRFFPDLLLNIVDVVVTIAISLLMKKLLMVHESWLNFMLACGVTGIVLVILNYFIILTKDQRAMIMDKLKKRINRSDA